MTVDYVSLRKENELRYGTDIGRIGGMLLANRYDKRTHFIFELLQNAEDALRRRRSWDGSKAVTFDLSNKKLRTSHFGQPFDEGDVRGVCGIDESTKDITAIGRFGIGFKSVYAFTDRPEIGSAPRAPSTSANARPQPHGTEREFVSYVAVHPEGDEGDDPDGLRADRLALRGASDRSHLQARASAGGDAGRQ